MRKLVSFMHVSLDGFTAGPNGEMEWILVDNSMFDFASERTKASDLALYGRVTFQMMEGYWPTAGDKPNPSKHDREHSAWYNKVDKVVLSTTLKEASFKNTKIISKNLAAEMQKIKQGDGKEIIIFGSPGAVHSLMEDDLIDEFWLFVNPILVGKGIPLFKNVKVIQKLKLVSTHVFDSGVVCLNYGKV